MNLVKRHPLAIAISSLGILTICVGILLGTTINSAIASEPDYVSIAQHTTLITNHGTDISTATAK